MIVLPRREAWTRQPNYAAEVLPAKCDAWLPEGFPNNLRRGRPPATVNYTYYLKSAGPAGAAIGRTGADSNFPFTLPAGGTATAHLFMLSRRTGAGQLYGTGNNRLTGVEGGAVAMYSSASIVITGTVLLEKGSVVYARWMNGNYVLCHRAPSGGFEYLTSGAGLGNADITQLCGSGTTAYALIARFNDVTHSRGEIESLVRNPWQIFA